MERGGDHRSRSMLRSCPYVSKHTAKGQRVWVHGIFEREEQLADLPKTGHHEMQIQEQVVLVSWLLCGYGREKYERDQGIYCDATKAR